MNAAAANETMTLPITTHSMKQTSRAARKDLKNPGLDKIAETPSSALKTGEFQLEAPFAKSVQLVAEFTEWEKKPLNLDKSVSPQTLRQTKSPSFVSRTTAKLTGSQFLCNIFGLRFDGCAAFEVRLSVPPGMSLW